MTLMCTEYALIVRPTKFTTILSVNKYSREYLLPQSDIMLENKKNSKIVINIYNSNISYI